MNKDLFLKRAEEFKYNNSDKDEQNRQLFIKKWPLAKIKTLTKEEYLLFCHDLLAKSIVSDYSACRKFVIYKEKGKFVKGNR